jgi:hypothetical protein
LFGEQWNLIESMVPIDGAYKRPTLLPLSEFWRLEI